MPVFLFTDIEGSTRLWDQHRQTMARALKRHNELLEETITRHGGQIVEYTGDGVYAVFEKGRPLQAVVDIQQQVASENWGAIVDLRIRIGLNACMSDQEGIEYFRDGDSYYGLAVSHTSRIMSAGWGGQILLTPAVLNHDRLPEGAELRDLGPHMLKSLAQPQRIYNLTHPAIPWQSFPPLNTLSTRPNNLPPQTTPFVNRHREVSRAINTLQQDNCRLLTLYGPGGVGKTRLAIQTAAELIGDFNEGVFFVPLASVHSSEYIVSAIAGTLNFSFHGSENQKLQLLSYLREKQLLLVADNFEHLLDGVGLLSDILEAAPNVKILSTCRERLNFAGEKVLEVRGLEIPDANHTDNLESFSTVQLFLNAVRRSQPEFLLTPAEAPAIVRICRLVAGMPLGIELAAAWVRMFSCQEIADQIEENLSFLMTNRPDVPERHRNLYAVCDYFWEQLAESERAILRKLSVFRGGFHSQAAWQVAGASAFFLSALVDRSFLRKVTITTTSRPDISNRAEAWRVRYEMHAVLRQYAAEKLEQFEQEKQETTERHGRYYADFLQRRESRLQGHEQQASLEQIIAEIDNIRSGWEWATQGGHIRAIEKGFESLFQAYDITNWIDEGVEIFGRTAHYLKSQQHIHKELFGRTLIRQANFLARTSQTERAEALIEEAIHLVTGLDLPAEVAQCYRVLGNIARSRGDLNGAIEWLQKSLALYRQSNDLWSIARVLSSIGDCNYRLGEYEGARQLYWECYNIYRRIGDPRGTAFILSGLGIVLNRLGEVDAAVVLLQESLKLYQSINDRWGIAIVNHNLGSIAYVRQDYIAARPYFEEGLSYIREMSSQWLLAAALNGLGMVLYELGEHYQAKDYLVSALELAQKAGLNPVLLESFVQAAAIAGQTGQPALGVELLAFALQHPALDKAETEDQAQKVWEVVTDKLSLEAVQLAQVQGEQKTLAEAIVEAKIILTKLGEATYHEPDRLFNRISQ